MTRIAIHYLKKKITTGTYILSGRVIHDVYSYTCLFLFIEFVAFYTRDAVLDNISVLAKVSGPKRKNRKLLSEIYDLENI